MNRVEKKPQISIIIPAYNVGIYIAATLESITTQTFSDWECIVVDDGSADETASIVSKYSQSDKRMRYLYQRNQGVAAARNCGFAISNPLASYVVFMDGDDIYH